MRCELEVHLLAAHYVPACSSISLVASLRSWSNSYIHHTVLTSFLSTWYLYYEHWRKKWFLSASTIGFMKSPLGLDRSDKFKPPFGVLAGWKRWEPQAGWSPKVGPGTPLFCLFFFFWWKFLVNLMNLVETEKVTQKQTHFRYFCGHFSMISWGKKQLNNTLMEWKQLLIKSFGHFDVLALVFSFCDESRPSSFWLGSIPDQKLTSLISKDECVMKLMSPLRTWNHILQVFFDFLDVSTLFFARWRGRWRWGHRSSEMRKSTESLWFLLILQGFTQKHQQFSIIGKKSPCLIF